MATGMGTKAALTNPMCDPETERFRWPFVASPPCVKEWKGGDNGGAVAQGVTDTTVKVVVLWNDLPPGAASTGIFVNQATGGADPEGARTRSSTTTRCSSASTRRTAARSSSCS